MANYAVSLAKLYRLSRLQPGFQAACLAKLADVHGKHKIIVTQDVAQRQAGAESSGAV